MVVMKQTLLVDLGLLLEETLVDRECARAIAIQGGVCVIVE